MYGWEAGTRAVLPTVGSRETGLNGKVINLPMGMMRDQALGEGAEAGGGEGGSLPSTLACHIQGGKGESGGSGGATCFRSGLTLRPTSGNKKSCEFQLNQHSTTWFLGDVESFIFESHTHCLPSV